MTKSLLDPESVDPDALLADLVRVAAAAYRGRLAAAFENPRGAFDRFHEIAVSRSLGEAAIEMHERPAGFGTLLEGGEEMAREAAVLGSRAYNARQAQNDPERAVKVLDEALTDVLGDVGGVAAAPRLRTAWDELATTYGPAAAAAIVRRRPRDFFGRMPEPEVVERAVNIAAARDGLRERLGLVQRPAYSRSAPLPRSLSDEEGAPEPLPAALQPRIVAAADGMRARLVAAYDEPMLAEARLHRLFDQHGLEGIRAAERDPTTLGNLRRDLPAGFDAARGAAEAALRYAEIAFQYHAARFPARAEELAAREALASATRSARDPERGMERIQEAIQLHGHDLEEYLGRTPDRGRDRGAGRGGPGGGGPELPDDDRRNRSAERLSGGGRKGDLAVEEAVQAFIAMHEARDEAARGQGLRDERAAAEKILTRLDQQDDVLELAETDFRAAATKVYVHPDRAFDAWKGLVINEKGNLQAAREQVEKRPEVLGPLVVEPHPAFPAAAKLGWGNRQPARDAVPRMLDRAVAYTKAERLVTDPVEWTTPAGDTIRGRDKVRDAAREVQRVRNREITTSDRRVRDLGGIEGSEGAAQQSYDRLTPAERDRAKSELAARGAGNGRTPRGMLPANLVGNLARAARVTRELGEGPAGL